MMSMLTPRDRGFRWRNLKFATAVAFYLQGAGLPVRLRAEDQRPLKLSEAILDEDPDFDTGTLAGLRLWSIFTHSDQRHDWSGNLREAQRAKGTAKKFAAVVQYRRAPATAGEMFVCMDLDTFTQVVAMTEGLAD